MTKEQTKEAAKVMLAWAEGNPVECRIKGCSSWVPFDYDEDFNYAKKSLNLPDDAFVDELFADTNEDCDELYGIVLHLAVLKDDCVEVVDEFDIEELEDDYYEKLVEYAEHHKGLHIKD